MNDLRYWTDPGRKRQLSDREVLTIRSVYQIGKAPSMQQLADVFRVTPAAIYKITAGLSYAHLPMGKNEWIEARRSPRRWSARS